MAILVYAGMVARMRQMGAGMAGWAERVQVAVPGG